MVKKFKTAEEELAHFDKTYPKFKKPERETKHDVLLASGEFGWDKDVPGFIKILKDAQSKAEATGKYSSYGFEDDGSQSYDGSWYDLVGYYLESDEDYENTIEIEQDRYDRQRLQARRVITDRIEKDKMEYNRLAERNGWPKR